MGDEEKEKSESYLRTEPTSTAKNKKSRTVLSSLFGFNSEVNEIENTIVSEFKKKFETLQTEIDKVTLEKINLKNTLEEYNNISIRYEEAKRTNKNLIELNKNLKNNYEKLASENQLSSQKQNEFTEELNQIKEKYKKEIEDIQNEINNKNKKINEYQDKNLKNQKKIQKNNSLLLSTKEKYETIKKNISDIKNSSKKSPEIEKKPPQENNQSFFFKKIHKSIEIYKNLQNLQKSKLDRVNQSINCKGNYINKLNTEILNIKNEIENLRKEYEEKKIKLENNNNEQTGYKNDTELKMRNKEIKTLKEKEKQYDSVLNEIKDILLNKAKIIHNKKQLNEKLIQLAKLKKAEVDQILNLSPSIKIDKDVEKNLIISISQICADNPLNEEEN